MGLLIRRIAKQHKEGTVHPGGKIRFYEFPEKCPGFPLGHRGELRHL